jgi:RNA polymerase sigma-70 factor (ECF subfamily)
MTAGDAQLLHRFHTTRDQAAFAELVRRHGPMVLGVCRRILQNHADAEDAFQATFLVLAQKAGTIRETETMAHWLYCVAANASRRLRMQRSIRRRMERRARTFASTGAGRITSVAPEHEDDDDRAARDVVPVLDEEVSRLPERLRAPVVLCYLHGKTYSEAAVELSVGEDTVRGRLARGREMLRSRLAGRGVALSAGALAEVLARNSASAASAVVPAPLLSSTCAAASQVAAAGLSSAAAAAGAAAVAKPQAVALAKQVIVSLMVTHVAPVAIVVSGVLLVGGAGLAIRQAFGNDNGTPSAQTTAITTTNAGGAMAPQPRGGASAAQAPPQNQPTPPPAAPRNQDQDQAPSTPPLAGPVSSLPDPVAEAVSNWRAGTLQQLRPSERSFTLVPDKNAADPQPRRYTLGVGVEIEVDRRRAQFSDLREGQRVYVNDMNGTPVQVRANTPRAEANP